MEKTVVRKEDSLSLFEKIWLQGKEAIKSLQKPIAQRKIRGNFISMHDNLTADIAKLEESINNKRADIENFDLKKIMEMRANINLHKDAQKELELEYKEYLGEDLKSRLD